MKEFIALDSHKVYSLAEREEVKTGRARQVRIAHQPGAIRDYLRRCEPGTVVAVEAMGYWYWIVREIEEAKLRPALVHPRKAKLMMGMVNKTDRLDVHGLNRLQRNQTLPTVWIPPAEILDQRELTRTRMVVSRQRTRLKNRILATLEKYGACVGRRSDPFGKAGRAELEKSMGGLPPQTRYVTEALLRQLDFVESQLQGMEARLKELVKITPEIELLRSLPCMGILLSSVAAFEIGDISRFGSAEQLASYAGTTPRVHSSGGKTYYGPLRPDVNRSLRWAFVEAANSVAVHQGHWPDRHVSRLYRRLRERKGHAKAVGAVARHLAEAAFHVLSQGKPYRDPALRTCPNPSGKGRSREG